VTLRIVPAGSRVPVPWQNGGGVTREIAVWPAGAPTDAFDWRISLAEVAADGPFSTFPGVDRTLTVVEGAGLDLTVGGLRRLVDKRHVPQDFPGDVPTHGRLLAGPVVNLNVMYRRGRAAATVAVVHGPVAVSVPPLATVVALALEGEMIIGGAALGRYDAAVITPCEAAGTAPLTLYGDGRAAALVTLRMAGGTSRTVSGRAAGRR
jgi:environmental stress-induced protein Ves